MADTLRHIQIETVAGCNARCTMCPVPTMQRPKGRMNTALFESIVDQAVAMGVWQNRAGDFDMPLCRDCNWNRVGE